MDRDNRARISLAKCVFGFIIKEFGMTGQGDSSSDTYHFIKKECNLHDIKLMTLSFFKTDMKTYN